MEVESEISSVKLCELGSLYQYHFFRKNFLNTHIHKKFFILFLKPFEKEEIVGTDDELQMITNFR